MAGLHSTSRSCGSERCFPEGVWIAQDLFYCGAFTSGHPQRVVGAHAGRGQILYCAQKEESNWCNGLLEVPPPSL